MADPGRHGVCYLDYLALASSSVRAAGVWYVAPNGNDGNACLGPASACHSIGAALTKPGFASGDTVRVAVGTYPEWVMLDGNASLSGGWNSGFTGQSGRSTIDGETTHRGVQVNFGVIVTMEKFIVANGSSFGDGAGIYVFGGTLTLVDSVVRNNTACNGCSGGGIFVRSGGTIDVINSVVISNHTGLVGGGIGGNGATINVVNSAVLNNHSLASGGGSGGGIGLNAGALTVINSTISGNHGRWGGAVWIGPVTAQFNNATITHNDASDIAGGIYNTGGTVSLKNTILADNETSTTSPECNGSITSLGNNLFGDLSDCTVATTIGDLVDVDPRLTGIFGSPGYHALEFDSPAIDAGNPGGCVDALGNTLTSDQRGAMRPMDGDGNAVAICDIGAYEFDPADPTIDKRAFFPIVNKNYCSPFADDFSYANSGWPVGNDSFVRSEYLNGEYRVVTKQGGFIYLFQSPSCERENYVVEADVHWSGPNGESHGIVFGIEPGFGRYYLFDISPDFQEFGLIRRDPFGFTILTPFTYSSAIKTGNNVNHLKVIRNGAEITLEVNGVVLGSFYDSVITGDVGAGVYTIPYFASPVSDARFDNFLMNNLPGSSPSRREQLPAESESLDYAKPSTYRDELPTDLRP